MKDIATQAASSLKTYLRIHDGDLTGLLEMVTAAQYNKKQKQLLEEYAIPLKIIEHERKLELASAGPFVQVAACIGADQPGPEAYG